MIQNDNNNTMFKTTHLDGSVYQTLFEYDGKQYWVGADYYPVSEGFLVSYKAGLAESWFASSFEYGTSFDDLIVQCAEEDIEQIVIEQIEANKERAAKRVLYTAYHVEHYFKAWSHNENKNFYEGFRAFPQYVPHAGKGKSILFRSSYMAVNFYFYCHINEDEKTIQVLGTSTDSSFPKVCSITIPAQYHGTYAELISEYYMSNRASLDNLVMTGTLPTIITEPSADVSFSEIYQPHFGNKLILWPDPAYTSDLGQP